MSFCHYNIEKIPAEYRSTTCKYNCGECCIPLIYEKVYISVEVPVSVEVPISVEVINELDKEKVQLLSNLVDCSNLILNKVSGPIPVYNA